MMLRTNGPAHPVAESRLTWRAPYAAEADGAKACPGIVYTALTGVNDNRLLRCRYKLRGILERV